MSATGKPEILFKVPAAANFVPIRIKKNHLQNTEVSILLLGNRPTQLKTDPCNSLQAVASEVLM